jgi:hypothetical protein
MSIGSKKPLPAGQEHASTHTGENVCGKRVCVVHACTHECVCVCVRARARVCAHVCAVHACVCICVCVRARKCTITATMLAWNVAGWPRCFSISMCILTGEAVPMKHSVQQQRVRGARGLWLIPYGEGQELGPRPLRFDP